MKYKNLKIMFLMWLRSIKCEARIIRPSDHQIWMEHEFGVTRKQSIFLYRMFWRWYIQTNWYYWTELED